MEKFTLKDFIAYNNPCFSCKENIKLRVVSTIINDNDIFAVANLRPHVFPEYTSIDLDIKYNKTLQMCVWHKSNKITCSDLTALKEFVKNRLLYLKSECGKCGTFIESAFLEFNLAHGYLKPTIISKEGLYTHDDHNSYYITSNVQMGKSEISVSKIFGSNTKITAPLILLGKLKTRERMIQKLKTYILFS